MKIDLHPDDLLDRDADGTLDDAARARLDAHLAVCVACRFEREARRDFACESAESDDRLSVPLASALLALKTAPPPVLPVIEIEPPRAPSVRVAAPRRRMRIGLLVAAAMMIVGAAAATTGAVRWISQPTPPPPAAIDAPSEPAPAKVVVGARPKTMPVVAAPAESAETPSAEPSALPAAVIAPVVVEPVAPVAAAPLPVAPAAPRAPAAVSAPAVAVAPVVEPPPVVAPVAPVAPAVRAAASLFSDANEARKRGDNARAIELYRELDRLHPQSAEARVGRATMGRMLLETGDARAALERFDAYLAPGSGTLSEEALLGRAESLARLGKAADERAAWQQLLRAYPSSPHAARARARLSALGGS